MSIIVCIACYKLIVYNVAQFNCSGNFSTRDTISPSIYISIIISEVQTISTFEKRTASLRKKQEPPEVRFLIICTFIILFIKKIIVVIYCSIIV